MTEDEAFIRAVVDSPGDDTPRLVYADWLDDHDDPRGPYLRAEVEWAKPWQSGERPTDSPQLRDIARGLSPLWVARVTRPPAGVCCDHVRFTNCGARLRQPDLNGLERRRGVVYPETYAAFLLNYNPGLLTPTDRVAADQGLECEPELCFYPIGHTYSTRFERIPDLESAPNWNAMTALSPLAIGDAGLTVFFLGVNGVFRGKVYSDCTAKPEWLWSGRPQTTDTPSLPSYLGRLTAKWSRARQHKYDI